MYPKTQREESVEPARRLDEREITELITVYRERATAASLTTAHGSGLLNSVKRLLHIAGAGQTSPAQRGVRHHDPRCRPLVLCIDQ